MDYCMVSIQNHETNIGASIFQCLLLYIPGMSYVEHCGGIYLFQRRQRAAGKGTPKRELIRERPQERNFTKEKQAQYQGCQLLGEIVCGSVHLSKNDGIWHPCLPTISSSLYCLLVVALSISFTVVTSVLCKKYFGNIKCPGIFYIAHEEQNNISVIAKLEGRQLY